MNRSKNFAVIFGSSLLAGIGCTAISPREIPVGHACQRGFAADMSPRYYHCAFELQDAWGTSPVFAKPDGAEQRRIVDALIAKDGGRCEVTQVREMSDPKRSFDHDLEFRIVTVACE